MMMSLMPRIRSIGEISPWLLSIPTSKEEGKRWSEKDSNSLPKLLVQPLNEQKDWASCTLISMRASLMKGWKRKSKPFEMAWIPKKLTKSN